MRRVITLTAAIIALRAYAGEPTDSIRAFVQRTAKATVQVLACPEKAEETKDTFLCEGAMADGQWVEVEAKRTPEGKIEIPRITTYPPTAESIRSLGRVGVTADFRSVNCPPDAGFTSAEFRCEATLVDGSRLTIPAHREEHGTVAFGRFIWDAASPSPLIQSLRKTSDRFGRTESFACPDQLSDAFDCEADYAGRGATLLSVRRTGATFRVEPTITLYFEILRTYAIAILVTGILAIVAGTAWLIALFVRSVVARLPFAAQQQVDLPAPGMYVLSIEAPFLTWIPIWRMSYAVIELATGQPIPVYIDIFPTHTSGVRRYRRSVRLFTVKHAGSYLVQVGIPPGRDVSRWNLVVSESFIGRGILCVLMIVGGVVLTLIGIVAR